MHYTDFPGAPAVGDILCTLSDIPEGGFFSTELDGFPILIVEGPRAYVNSCPHQFLPLDHRGPEVIGANGQTILCSNHGATFDLSTGKGTGGHGIGCNLVAVPMVIENGKLLVAP